MRKIRKTLQRFVISMLVLTALIPQICQAEENDVIDLANEYFLQGDYEGEISLLEEAATEGDVQAAYKLGYYYQFGQYVEKDSERAAAWYKVAALGGSAEGMRELGILYRIYGEGADKNKLTAGIILKKAVNAGSIQAMNDLGVMYAMEKNYEKAMEWYETAIENGSETDLHAVSRAMENLGTIYKMGWGVEQNDELAQEWYEKSSEAEELYYDSRYN